MFRMHQLQAGDNQLHEWLSFLAEQKQAAGGPCKHVL